MFSNEIFKSLPSINNTSLLSLLHWLSMVSSVNDNSTSSDKP